MIARQLIDFVCVYELFSRFIPKYRLKLLGDLVGPTISTISNGGDKITINR